MKSVDVFLVIKSLSCVRGGAERLFCQLANYLHSTGVNVAVVTWAGNDKEMLYPLNNAISRVTMNVRGAGPMEQISLMRQFSGLLGSSKPNVVVAFLLSAYFPVSIVCRQHSVPVIASEHCSPELHRNFTSKLALLMSRYFVSRYTMISDNIARMYDDRIRAKSTIIPNSIDPQFRGNEVEREVTTKAFLGVGRFTYQKGFDLLVHAFYLTGLAALGWKLFLVGGGDKTQIEGLLQEFDLNSSVSIYDEVASISEFYQSATIFVCSSRYEGFGLVTAEAMATGLPCVGFSSCPGTNELIEDGLTGVLAPAMTAESLADSMLRIVSMDYKKMGIIGRDRANKMFSEETMMNCWSNLLSEYIGNSSNEKS